MLWNATWRKLSPSYRLSMPNLAPQMRVALSSMVSNTGLRSPGEVEMTCRTSDVAVCCSRVSANSRARKETCSCRSAIEELRRRTAVGVHLRFGLVVLACRVVAGFRLVVCRRCRLTWALPWINHHTLPHHRGSVVRRSKGGMTGVHPIGGRELRALRRLQRETPDGARTMHIFVSERLAPLTVAGYQRMVARAGVAADFPFLISSHVFRHSCGYKLANDGHDTRAIQHYLGHRSIVSTVRYTALAPDRFKGFWKD